MHRTTCLLALISPLLCSALLRADEDRNWQRVRLDDRFVSEGVAVADVNRDGRLDVLTGDLWYAAPDWQRHEIRPAGKYEPTKGFSRSFGNWTADVNGDGWDDLIVIGFPGKPIHWYANPGNQAGENRSAHWKEYPVWHYAGNESPDFADLDGDGRPELIVGSEPERQLGFLPLPSREKAAEKWSFHPLGEPGDSRSNGAYRYYHGLGTGDMNGDGRIDVVIPHGWFEVPVDRTKGPGVFHPIQFLADGEPIDPPDAADIHIHDFDGDGHPDLAMSSGHGYGVWWFRNRGDDRWFERRKIDDSVSQTHALVFADIDGDGDRDLVTGKRYLAHKGKDPGSAEPVVMVWYEYRAHGDREPEFVRHEIVAGRDTGIGTQFLAHDMNADGKLDLVLSNKKGVNILLQNSRAAQEPRTQ